MGRSSLTETQNISSAPATQGITLRLQQLISNWGGAQRGQPFAALHQECINAVGRGSRLQYRLLPSHVLPVADLDATNLQYALRHFNGVGRNTQLEFRVTPMGRFDAALIPVGRVGEQPDRLLLAVEQGLSTQDQVALYGHAVGHLLLNYQEEQLERTPQLDPRNGYAHADTLAELRLLEAVKQALDRRVLETYPLLTRLLEVPEESPAAFDSATADLRQQLARSGWSGQYAQMHYRFTDGRVFTSSPRRGTRLYVDALLRAAPSLPIAIVHTLRAGEEREDAIRRIQEYARRLAVPFAYLLNENSTMQEFDWSRSREAVCSTLFAFPDRETLWTRWAEALQLTDPKHQRVLQYPYRLSGNKRPRYYQEAAINSAVIAVLQAQRGLRPPRILITLATGTGKTLVAFQLLWKLKRERAVRNVLFLTDRDFLLSQAMDNEFAPFGDARYRIKGDASTAYDVDFATYQAITSTDQDGQPQYLRYPPNFFDIVIIDECHRGSASEASQWRDVLKYFSGAIQIGLTATPLSTETVQTDEYFGEPIYTYSLHMGISDGFLAPYRVRRIIIGQTTEDGQSLTPVQNPSEELDLLSWGDDEDASSFANIPVTMETPGTMMTYTWAIAQHLAAFLQRSDTLDKTIIFCVNQKHAEDMRQALQEACASWAPKNAEYIVRIVSEEGMEGRRALGNFTTPAEKFPVIVTTSKLLGTGVDVPTCKNIVLARPVGSIVEFKQIIGRGTRLFEPDKYWFTILDYVGTIKHFFDPDFDGDPELVEQEPLVPEPAGAKDTQSPEDVPTSPGMESTTVPASIFSDGTILVAPTKDTSSSLPSTDEAVGPVHKGQEQYPVVEVHNHMQAAIYDHRLFVDCGQHDTQGGGQTILAIPPANDLAGQNTPHGSGEAEVIDPANPSPGTHIINRQTKSGRVFRVIGEFIYELGSDGSTLRRGTYRECTVTTIRGMMGNPADLRARWRVPGRHRHPP
jgi:type I restriction enzyme R subunit